MTGLRSRFLLLALLCLAVIPPAHADKRVALVIGNSAYRSVTPLDNPRNDATLMAETLRGLGFTLVGEGAQLNLDKAAIDRAVQKFGNELLGADVGLFYYAGHGLQVRGANYLVPIDANPMRETDVDFQMLDANVVLRQMEGAGTKLNLVILDACRNNPFGGRGLRAVDRGLAIMQAPEGTLISFATQPGNVARDGTDGNSPYTKALAQTMRKPGLDVFRTFNEVGLAVASATGGMQQPWMSLSPIKGDFYFAGGAQTGNVEALPETPAAQAWAAAKDTTSVAVLEEFLRRFGDSFYAALARAKLEELKKRTQVAVVSPPTAVPTVVAPPIEQALPTRITGRWSGWHQCGGARVGTSATIYVDSAGHVSGIREFYPTPADTGHASGSFRLGGVYHPADRSISLIAGNWINQPAGYGKCDFVGKVDPSGMVITGTSPGCYPGCDNFELKRK
jgi:hypothetical protein